MIIEKYSYPRAALIGNPSDGYFGKTIAFLFRNFGAKITLYETPELQIKPEKLDTTYFNSIDQLVNDVSLYGYYGGMRLLKAAIKVFYCYCQENNIELHKRNFTIRYSSNIPIRLGLAGSSALITAGMRALCEFYNVTIPPQLLANLVLSVETKELGLSAGLQDRVAQAYEMPVFMDFDKEYMDKNGYGKYAPIPLNEIPGLYIAYRTTMSEGSEVVHNNLRARFNIGDKQVLSAMEELGEITVATQLALKNRDWTTLSDCINRNFDIRKDMIPISKGNQEMVDIARECGASAKFTGSGGAIIGICQDKTTWEEMKIRFKHKNINMISPVIVNQEN